MRFSVRIDENYDETQSNLLFMIIEFVNWNMIHLSCLIVVCSFFSLFCSSFQGLLSRKTGEQNREVHYVCDAFHQHGLIGICLCRFFKPIQRPNKRRNDGTIESIKNRSAKIQVEQIKAHTRTDRAH